MSTRFPESNMDQQKRSARQRAAVRTAARTCVETLEGRVLLSSTVVPIADSFTRDHDYILTNFGASPLLIVKQATSGDNRIAYLKFDLSGAGTINLAASRRYLSS